MLKQVQHDVGRTDRAFLDWPFFDERHRELAEELERWCEAELTDEEPDDVDQACRDLVRKLGDGGWLRHCVPDAAGRHRRPHSRPDPRDPRPP